MMECEKLNVSGSSFIWERIERNELVPRMSGIGTLTKQDDGTFVIGDDYKLISIFLTDNPASTTPT
jgi:hypothetical protein